MNSKLDKLKELENKRQKYLDKLKEIDNVFKEEKENEEAWPGHSSTRYQSADADYQVFRNILNDIEKEIKILSN